jgi:hypothetical protein
MMEYPSSLSFDGTGWSVDKKDVQPSPITPTLHYSNTPKIVVIEKSIDGLHDLGS